MDIYRNLSTSEYDVVNFIEFCSPIFFLHSSIADKYWINKSNWSLNSFNRLSFHPAFISTIYKNIYADTRIHKFSVSYIRLHTKEFFDSLESKLPECISMLTLPSKSLLTLLFQSIVSCFIPNKSIALNIDIFICTYKKLINSPTLKRLNFYILYYITYIVFLGKWLFKMFLYNFMMFVSYYSQTCRTSRNSFQCGKPILGDDGADEPALLKIFPIADS